MLLVLTHSPDVVSVLAKKLGSKRIRRIFLRIHGIKLYISKIFKSIRLRFIKIRDCVYLTNLLSLFGFLTQLVGMSSSH
jgi:hypothetical protein